jgi:two-component system chemotaxis response regulator CheY
MSRVLIVDDAATVRMYHRHILAGAGFDVTESVNGIEALECALQQPFDLYLVDVNMPRLDGYGFLRELRSQLLPQAPAIMISTEAERSDRERAFAAGANAYLEKPVRPDTLLMVVRALAGVTPS